MVTANTNDFDEDLAAIDKRAIDLMAEFEDHYQDTIKLDPSAEGRREHVFHAWTFQKLAGIHHSIEEIARKFNAHLNLPK
jgi:hypothetical protein